MATSKQEARDAWRRQVRSELKKADDAFKGQYAEELQGLLGLSQAEIDKITPDNSDLQIYHQLITVVEAASRQNVAQADLRAQIAELGDTAVKIAKQVAPLAKLFL